MILNAVPDNLLLHTDGRGEANVNSITLSLTDNLTDPQGNLLTDPHGNYLVYRYSETVYALLLHAEKDDFNLVASAFDTTLVAEPDDLLLNAENT